MYIPQHIQTENWKVLFL